MQQRRIGQLAQGNDRQRGRGSGGTLSGGGNGDGGKTVDLSGDDEDENILTFDDIEGEKLPDEEAKP